MTGRLGSVSVPSAQGQDAPVDHQHIILKLSASVCLVVAALVVGLAVPIAASAATRSCGVERPLSGGAIFRVKATNTRCKTAKQVAGGWWNVTSHGHSGRVVYDGDGRRWRCRITERATGTDPGYIPYTSVRCPRRKAVVRFKQRS